MGATFGELAERIAQVSDIYAARTGVERDDDWYPLKIMEEAGELAAEHLRLSGRGRRNGNTPDEIAQARDDEVADLFAMVVLYCHHNGIDIEAALERKWFKHLKATQ
jgi:NTP pyrophosphatase (non-canonical NTP hydrolase)